MREIADRLRAFATDPPSLIGEDDEMAFFYRADVLALLDRALAAEGERDEARETLKLATEDTGRRPWLSITAKAAARIDALTAEKDEWKASFEALQALVNIGSGDAFEPMGSRALAAEAQVLGLVEALKAVRDWDSLYDSLPNEIANMIRALLSPAVSGQAQP